MAEFQIAQNALDACKVIVDHQKEIVNVRLIAHEVHTNWRELYQTPPKKEDHLAEGFVHQRPLAERTYSRQQFIGLPIDQLFDLKENQVWSITSKVQCANGKTKHIPMMNFHPERVTPEVIKKALEHICGEKRGVLLDSGRFQHYYGDFLLEDREWIQFLAEFLMPTILVSPRYIGHRLHDGYCTLRLTKDKDYKPTIPHVREIL